MADASRPTGPGLFFTGTDTGVGKTMVTAAVARALRQQRRAVVVCKPVATGARRVGSCWQADDTAVLADAAGRPGDWERITPWAFPDEVAPPLAARRQRIALNLSEIAATVRLRAEQGAALLVEGVGGFLCPLTESATLADLIGELRLPLIVVARRSLGTLNHTLLTLEAVRARGVRLAGVVVSETVPVEGLAAQTNVDEMRRLGIPVLAVLCHQADPRAAAGRSFAAVDWWNLCNG